MVCWRQSGRMVALTRPCDGTDRANWWHWLGRVMAPTGPKGVAVLETAAFRPLECSSLDKPYDRCGGQREG